MKALQLLILLLVFSIPTVHGQNCFTQVGDSATTDWIDLVNDGKNTIQIKKTVLIPDDGDILKAGGTIEFKVAIPKPKNININNLRTGIEMICKPHSLSMSFLEFIKANENNGQLQVYMSCREIHAIKDEYQYSCPKIQLELGYDFKKEFPLIDPDFAIKLYQCMMTQKFPAKQKPQPTSIQKEAPIEKPIPFADGSTYLNFKLGMNKATFLQHATNLKEAGVIDVIEEKGDSIKLYFEDTLRTKDNSKVNVMAIPTFKNDQLDKLLFIYFTFTATENGKPSNYYDRIMITLLLEWRGDDVDATEYENGHFYTLQRREHSIIKLHDEGEMVFWEFIKTN
ncbi:MAG: hypothetical protein SFW35_00875 [Chitinophagales bacterium]|nr:hypothetical protein [Chitinophagales bacterium]